MIFILRKTLYIHVQLFIDQKNSNVNLYPFWKLSDLGTEAMIKIVLTHLLFKNAYLIQIFRIIIFSFDA